MFLAPNAVLQFFDNNGEPLVGGKLFVYAAGTTTKQPGFNSSAGNVPLPDPIILNVRGEVAPSATGASCGLWLDPALAYKFVLAPPTDTDPPTNSYWTVDNIVSADAAVLAALAAYEATIAGIPIGGMIPYAGATAPSGWLLCYGQQISRTTYAALFSAIGTAYGIGDGTTTFNLPDKRGRVSIGKDDMGGTAALRITNAISGISGTTLGAAGGDQNTAPDTLTASSAATTGVTDPGHQHVVKLNTNGGGPAVGEITSIAGGSAPDGHTETAFTGVAVSVAVTTTVTGTNTGASQNVQPSQVDNVIVYTGVSS